MGRIDTKALGFALLALSLLVALPARADVGRTAGTGTVTPLGTASYSIPLWTPRGAGGMTPRLTLAYSHQSENGLLGVGWSLAGLTVITRCNKTTAQDGLKAAPQLSSGDAYCLDGNRLRRHSGTYGASGSTYRTELNGFERITAQGGDATGPSSFTVDRPDGTTLEYGASADSRIPTVGSAATRVWALTSMTDAAGNRAQFVYTNDTTNGSFRPDEIRYATNASGSLTTAPYTVKFLYESRPDPIYAFAHGSASVNGRVNEFNRLDRIEVRHQGSPVRIYDLSYGTSGAGSGGRSRITSLVECSTSMSSCFTPSTFAYLNSTAAFQGTTALSGTYGWLMDVDGDGKDDTVYSSGNTWRIRLSTGTGLGTEINTGITVGSPEAALPIEWDGDGRTDLLVGYYNQNWQVLRSLGTTLQAADTGAPYVCCGYDHVVVDLNGDGRDDVISKSTGEWETGNPRFLDPIYIQYREGLGLTARQQFATLPEALVVEWDALISAADKQRTAKRKVDFNGDGREDSFIVYREGLGWSTSSVYGRAILSNSVDPLGPRLPFYDTSSPVWVGDFNGDGLSDVATIDVNAIVQVHSSNGTAFTTASGPSLAGFDAYNFGSVVADHDGDGRDDLLIRNSAGSLHVLYGNGASLAPPVSTGVSVPTSSMLKVGDLNGDSFGDLVYTDGGAVARLHGGVPADLLSSATDGFGVAASFTYAPLTDASVYTKGTGASYPLVDLQSADFVVRKLTLTDGSGTGATYDIDFTYAGGRFSLDGRGFLGFASGTRVDKSAGHNVRTEDAYSQAFPTIGALTSRVVMQSSGTKIQETTNTWAALQVGAAGVDLYAHPYVTNSQTKDYEVAPSGSPSNGAHIRTTGAIVSQIDGTSGLITDVTRTITEVSTGLNPSSSRSERIQHTAYNDLTNWCLGRSSYTTVTVSHTLAGGAPIVRTSNASWDGVYCRPSELQIQPSEPAIRVTVGLQYDAFGNVNRETVTGNGMTPRETEFSFGAAGVFPVWIADPLDQATTQAWNYALGVPTSMVDPNGLSTSWAYDGFGRPMSETRADQTSTLYTRVACAGGCDTRARWSLEVRPRTTGGAVIRTDRVYFDQFDRALRSDQQLSNGGTSIESRDRDARGRVIAAYLPYWSGFPHNGYRASAYDALNRPTSIALRTSTGALDRQTTVSYEGLSVLTTDPIPQSTRQWLTAWGDLAQVSDAAGGHWGHEYDAFGNLTKVTDAYNNVASQTTYNARGMRTGLTDMNLGTWTFAPNALGEVTHVRDARTAAPNWTQTFSYDLLGRVTARDEAEGTSYWTWGSASHNTGSAKYIGALKQQSGPGFSETFTNDAYGRVVSRSITTDTTYQIDYQYNALGSLHQLTYPASLGANRFKVEYGYAYGQPVWIQEKTGDVAGSTLWSQVAIDPQGNLLEETYANSLRVISGYSPLTGALEYRQAGVGGSTTNRQVLAYEWNKVGSLVRREDTSDAQIPRLERFYYDALQRLDYSTLNGSNNLDVTLDLIGNVTYRSDVGSYAYHATKKHAVTSAGGLTFAYDANGNMTSRSEASGATAITWTSYNLPSSIAFTPAGGGTTTNVALNKPTTSSGSPCAANEGSEKAVNGSVSGGNPDKWCSLQSVKWMQVDLQSVQSITQLVVKHAEAGGESSSYNTKDFNIQVSSDGSIWSTLVTVSGNTAGTTTHPVTASARYVRLNVITPTQSWDTAARIYELEVYAGSSGTPHSSQFFYAPDRSYFRQNAVYANGTSWTEYVGGLFEKVVESGVVQYRHMVPAGNGVVVVTREDKRPTQYRYIVRDHLGSTSLITDASGATVMTQSFAAYGGRRQSNWQTGTPAWAPIADTTRLGYTGHTMLDNLGLVHMNGRVYDPVVGRFLSADPVADGLGEAGGYNRYSYVRNDPLSSWDPLGLRRYACVDTCVSAYLDYIARSAPALREWLQRITSGGDWSYTGPTVGATPGPLPPPPATPQPPPATEPLPDAQPPSNPAAQWGHAGSPPAVAANTRTSALRVNEAGVGGTLGRSVAAWLATMVAAGSNSSSERTSGDETADHRFGSRIAFGQPRISPGTYVVGKGHLPLEVTAALIRYFDYSPLVRYTSYKGQDAALNNRTLAAYGIAGVKPTNILFEPFDTLDDEERKRFYEDGVPAFTIPVTPSKNDPTVLYYVTAPP